jgi:hypothetical protein
LSYENDDAGVGPDADHLPARPATAADLRSVFVRAPSSQTAERHLAAMVSASVAPVVPLRSGSKRVMVAGLVAAAAIVLTGGLAAAGVLPAAVQNGVSRLARPLGVNLPSSDHHDERIRPDPGSTTTTAPTGGVGETPAPSSTPGATAETPDEATGGGPTTAATGGGGGGGGGGGDASTTTSPGKNGASSDRSGTAPGQTDAGGNNKPAVSPGQVDSPGDGNGDSPGKGNGNSPGKGNGNGNVKNTTAG